MDSVFVEKATEIFCTSVSQENMTSGSAEISKNYQAADNVNYMFEVEWESSCHFTSDSQRIAAPIGDLNCEALIKETFYGCNNGGVGGSIKAGCLTYSFIGGLGDDQVPVPEDIADEDPEEDSEDPANDTDEQTEGPSDAFTDLVVGEQICFDTGEFSHQDIEWSIVRESSKAFYNRASWADGTTQRNMTAGAESYGFFAAGGVYFHIEWREGCETGTNSINVLDPLGDDGRSCSELIKKTWKDCNNNEGVGGSVDVGCLSYAVVGGKDLYKSLYGDL